MRSFDKHALLQERDRLLSTIQSYEVNLTLQRGQLERIYNRLYKVEDILDRLYNAKQVEPSGIYTEEEFI